VQIVPSLFLLRYRQQAKLEVEGFQGGPAMAEQETLEDYLKRTLAAQKRVPGPLGFSVPEPAGQINALMNGAADVLPFRFADNLASAVSATAQPWDWKQRYDTNMAAETARDRRDEVLYPVARSDGQLGLTLAILARGGRLTGPLAAPRLPGAAKITSREALSMLGAGAAVGAGTQAVGDLATGKLSSAGDYAGAGIGGVAGVAALPLKPDRAAAIDGIVTSVAQDLLNGRPVSTERAGQNAMAGRMFGAIANKAAATYTENLAPVLKGSFGETLGAIRAIADWQRRMALGNTLVKIPGTNKRWKPDAVRGEDPHAADALLYEDKFGRKAKLRPNQELAQEKLGENFQLNHFLPRDIGMAASAVASALGIQAQKRSVPPTPPQRKR
jgi:hypothetical protein